LDQNVVLVEEDDDGEGAGEGGADDWQSDHVNWLSWDVRTVERLATMARRSRRPRPWRWPDADHGMAGVARRSGLAKLNNPVMDHRSGMTSQIWVIAVMPDLLAYKSS
jgi:hypothetical protein